MLIYKRNVRNVFVLCISYFTQSIFTKFDCKNVFFTFLKFDSNHIFEIQGDKILVWLNLLLMLILKKSHSFYNAEWENNVVYVIRNRLLNRIRSRWHWRIFISLGINLMLPIHTISIWMFEAFSHIFFFLNANSRFMSSSISHSNYGPKVTQTI